MLSEYPETDPLFIGAERLGRLVGRSGRWVRQRENERVIERASLNGQSPRRPIYEADKGFTEESIIFPVQLFEKLDRRSQNSN